jgi:type IV pilus assembly protein PilC
VLGDVEEKIRGGDALSQAFASQGSVFPRIYTASILAGERSGALDEVLNRYVTYMRRNVALRRKIRGALAYPMFLLFASACMVTFLTIYVVPRMSELFTGFGNELPTVTQIVVGLSRWLSTNVLWFGPLFIGGAVFLFIWSRTPGGKLQITKDSTRGKPRSPDVRSSGDTLAGDVAGGWYHARRVVGNRIGIDHEP